MRSRLATIGGPTVGVAWRSEYRSPMRDFHYLTVDELGPVLDVCDTIICLQHDATDGERDLLTRSAPGRVVFVDDVDLRDDFESTAALSSALDVIVSIGTTVAELEGPSGRRRS